jgi:hypothetical protein
MIIPLLQEMREEMRVGFAQVDERLTRVEASLKSVRSAMTHDTMLSKFVLGEFEERLALVEQRLEQITTKPA